MVAPRPGDEHQQLALEFSLALRSAIARRAGRVRPGINLSDRADDWQEDYRAPDAAVCTVRERGPLR